MILSLEHNNIISHLLKIKDDNSLCCIQMLEYFILNYPDAPGSSGNHQAYPGGYYKHISDILDYASELYKSFNKGGLLPFSLSDSILVLFLHDIEKPIKYSNTNFKNDNEIRNFLIEKFKFKLNEEHLIALKYIHGEGDDYKKNNRVMTPLCAFCHCCDVFSARIFYA